MGEQEERLIEYCVFKRYEVYKVYKDPGISAKNDKEQKQYESLSFTVDDLVIFEDKQKIEWHANRVLSKVNYVVHTDAVKNYIVPTLTEEQRRFVYAEEVDVLNVALFGMTAKEWRQENPELAKKEILETIQIYYI